MTLVEAVNHVNEHDGNGLEQIRTALSDGEIPALWVWIALPEGPIGTINGLSISLTPIADPPLFSDEPFPTDRDFWQSAVFLLEDDGKVNDPAQGYFWTVRKGGELVRDMPVPSRSFYLLKERVLELWPIVAKRGKLRSPDASLADIQKAADTIYSQSPLDPPNVVEAEKRIRAILPTARRPLIKSVLEKPEFSNRRRPPGNRSKS